MCQGNKNRHFRIVVVGNETVPQGPISLKNFVTANEENAECFESSVLIQYFQGHHEDPVIVREKSTRPVVR